MHTWYSTNAIGKGWNLSLLPHWWVKIRVSQQFCNVLVTRGTIQQLQVLFAKVVKVTNYTEQWDTKFNFASGPGDLGSIPGRVIPKTQKMILDAALLKTQRYKVRIKSKVDQSRECRSALPLHIFVVVIEKGAFRSPSAKVANFTYNSSAMKWWFSEISGQVHLPQRQQLIYWKWHQYVTSQGMAYYR